MDRSQVIEKPGISQRQRDKVQAAQVIMNQLLDAITLQSMPNFNAGKVSGKPRFKAIQ